MLNDHFALVIVVGVKRMARKLFGTDGIRGVANVDPMTGEMAMQLGRAIAHVFKEAKGKHRIVVGKDTRVSGYMLETALASGICSMGADVWLVGPLPTPGIAFITTSMRANAGVLPDDDPRLVIRFSEHTGNGLTHGKGDLGIHRIPIGFSSYPVRSEQFSHSLSP